jgi:hypothetical protein
MTPTSLKGALIVGAITFIALDDVQRDINVTFVLGNNAKKYHVTVIPLP